MSGAQLLATAVDADEGGNNLPITLLLVALAVLVLGIVLVVVRRARRAAIRSTRSTSASEGRRPIR